MKNTMMEQIFKNIHKMSAEGQCCEKALSEVVGSILELIKENEKADIEDLVFQASRHGQQLGFESGFKLGVRFMVDALGGGSCGSR
jgi:hypothetical protein